MSQVFSLGICCGAANRFVHCATETWQSLIHPTFLLSGKSPGTSRVITRSVRFKVPRRFTAARCVVAVTYPLLGTDATYFTDFALVFAGDQCLGFKFESRPKFDCELETSFRFDWVGGACYITPSNRLTFIYFVTVPVAHFKLTGKLVIFLLTGTISLLSDR